MPEPRRKPRAVLLGGALALAVLLAAAWANREAIVLEWYRYQLAPYCKHPDFINEKYPELWLEVLESGERSHPILARLLADGDFEVWSRTAMIIDLKLFEAGRNALIAYLRARHPLALLRYLMPDFGGAGDEWRWTDGRGDLPDGRWYLFWHGWDGAGLPPTPEGIRFCERILAGGYPEPSWSEDDGRGLKLRAIDALAAMLVPADPPGEAVHAAWGSPDAERIAAILARAMRDDGDLEVRRRAIHRLAQLSGRSWFGMAPDLGLWELFSRHGPRPGTYIGQYLSEAYLHPDYLAELVHLDHPWTLLVLARLERYPEFRERLDPLLASRRSPLPVPVPEWRPLAGAARRFVGGGRDERALSAAALAILGDPEGIPVLEEFLGREEDPELRLLQQAALLALGAMAHREAVRNAFHGWLADWLQSLGKAHDGASFLTPLGFADRWERVVLAVPGPVPVNLWDLATLILWSGDREFLDELVGFFLHGDPIGADLELADFLEGFPVRIVWRVHGTDHGWYSKITEENVGHLKEELAAYWEEFRDRLAWDPAARRFTPGVDRLEAWHQRMLGSADPEEHSVARAWLAARGTTAVIPRLLELLGSRKGGPPVREERNFPLDVGFHPVHRLHEDVGVFRESDGDREWLVFHCDSSRILLEATLEESGGFVDLAQAADGAGEAAVPFLADALGGGDATLRFLSALVLGQLGPRAAGAIPSLVAAARDPEVLVRQEAARSLGAADPEGKTAIPLLIELLDDPADSVAAVAARALGRHGPVAGAAAEPALAAAIRARSNPVRVYAAGARWRIDGRAAAAVPVLIEILDKEKGFPRHAAIEILGEIGPEARPALESIRRVLAAEEDSAARLRMALALDRIAPGQPEALKHLRDLAAEHWAEEIRLPAIEALDRIRDAARPR